MDMRDGDVETMQSFLTAKSSILSTLEKMYGVSIVTSVEQVLAPLRLDLGKNVSLILDGSIGGSHNPREAEHPEVVLTGTILQLAATLKFMEDPEQKIFDVIEEIMPDTWRERMQDFSSGALHDACQIAAGIEARQEQAYSMVRSKD